MWVFCFCFFCMWVFFQSEIILVNCQLYSGLCFLTHLQKEKNQNQMELHAKLEKLDMLEEECLKLTATQRIAEVSKHGISMKVIHLIWVMWHTVNSANFSKSFLCYSLRSSNTPEWMLGFLGFIYINCFLFCFVFQSGP